MTDWLTEVQISGGGDIVMDDYDIVDEKPDVASITNDEVTPDAEPLADDCTYPFTKFGEALADSRSTVQTRL